MDKRTLIFVLALVLSLFFISKWFNPTPAPQVVQTTQETAQPRARGIEGEQFFVLENDFQQLVFSNVGGALAEINLPLQSKNKQSPIRPIRFDREIQQDSPENDRFPGAYTHKKGALGGYYPLLRRNILDNAGRVIHRFPARYYALNLITEDPKEESLLYSVSRHEKNLIEFQASTGHRRITKTYSFCDKGNNAPYCFNLSLKVEGDARGLWLTSGIPEVELISGSPSPTLKYQISRNGKPDIDQLSLPKATTAVSMVQPDWVCNSNGFFGLIIDPLRDAGAGFTTNYVAGKEVPTRLSLIDAQNQLYPAEKYPGYEIQLPVSRQATYRIFAGPFVTDILKKLDATYSDPAKGYNPNYIGSQSYHGWFSFISEPFAKFLFILMQFFYAFTKSWGLSIILLTIALRVMLYPLNNWSIKATAKMQQIAPQVTAIQERYKKEPKRAQMEIMALYKERKVNPMSGCLPLLIQIPFLIGMFDLLKSIFELRGAPFIPGWIDNLTAPDVIFSWGVSIPFFGTDFHLLPFLLGGVMYVQQKFSSTAPKNPNAPLTDQQKQQKMMGNIMTIVFTVMFYNFPSGLNIYWLFSMLLGILQQWWTTKKLKDQPEVLS